MVTASVLQRPLTDSCRVDVTLYVMSRCPDAVSRCLKKSDGSANVRAYSPMSLQVWGAKSTSLWATSLREFSMSNTDGRRNDSEPLGYSCKHGELECAGNAHQLCLQKYLSTPVFYANLLCQNRDYVDVGKLSLTKQCAGVDWNRIGKCIQEESQQLLKENVKHTAKNNVQTSCTIDIHSTLVDGGLRRCVVDGGIWRGCNVSIYESELMAGWTHCRRFHTRNRG